MGTSSFNAPSQFIQDGEVGPIPRAEVSTLGVYLGMSDLADTTAPSQTARSDMGADDQLDQLLALGMGEGGSGAGGMGRTGSAASSVDGDRNAGSSPVGGGRSVLTGGRAESACLLCLGSGGRSTRTPADEETANASLPPSPPPPIHTHPTP